MPTVTLHTLRKLVNHNEPIVMLTAYDYPTARLIDAAGVEIILVGDSLGMVVHGLDSTLPVTMDMMLLHTQAVRRGTTNALLAADMPFMSYQTTPEDALRNAARFLQEAGADAVKLEGGRTIAPTIRRLVDAGIAVMGHVGLTPQSVSAFGGFRVQGKGVAAAQGVLDDALAVQDAGAFSVVLEGVPGPLAQLITARLDIPTIGIGAGVGCNGQVLVVHDLLGLGGDYAPKFVKAYADLAPEISDAVARFRAEVKARTFPADAHTYTIAAEDWAAITAALGATANGAEE
jgi:3-methyl-2-oxobutanoate hydroxymethyltransferase